jgi:hypothetical protein
MKLQIAIILTLAMALTACGVTAVPGDGQAGSVFSTGFAVSPLFADYFAGHGGARVMGEPISGEVPENGATGQYFQNVKLEYHPQLPAGSQIMPASLGQERYGQAPCVPAASANDTLYFNNCHSVDPIFRGFFEKLGGVAFFGYPLSERYIFKGTQLAQNFERAVIVWDATMPAAFQLGLQPLGTVACPPQACATGINNRAGIPIVPPAATATAVAAADPIVHFYQAHGGARVFGQPAGAYQTADDGRRQMIFDNAILVEDSAAQEGVSLRPLGLLMLGSAQSISLPFNGPSSRYFTKYGHNITYQVYDFYNAYGGQMVFGQPITELETASGKFVQYFENAAFTVHYNLPPDQVVQLAPLGRLNAHAVKSPQPADPPQVLVIKTQPLRSVFDPTVAQQMVTAQVTDENGRPVSGAQVRFLIHTPAGDMEKTLSSDANGFASYTFKLASYQPGDFMLYDAEARLGDLKTAESGSFVTWGSATP